MASQSKFLDHLHDFRREHGATPKLFQAPGRVNLIGEHTDYNEGFVLPAAIQLHTRVAAVASNDRRVHVRSTFYSDEVNFDLDTKFPPPQKHWGDYVRGVTVALAEEGVHLIGTHLLVDSDIPPGAGLSSSAALEVATAMSLLSVAGHSLSLFKVAKICNRVENDFLGVRSGLMDQFAACFGRKDMAMLLDCRTLEARYVPLLAGAAMMVCNTMVRHELASGEYNARRVQCESGVAALSTRLSGVRALRDVSATQLKKFPFLLDPVIHRRCRHVVTENQRVLTAVRALEGGDIDLLGEAMMESHQSLRLDYEVSCPELDLMCELALSTDKVVGARMIGGGFGGCVLALVENSAVAAFRQKVADEYRARTGIECEIYECFASNGAGPLQVSEE